MKIYQEQLNLSDDYIRHRDLYWKRLRAVRGDNPDMSIPQFLDYMKNTYGVRMIMDGDKVRPEHEVLDEAKFMFLILKYE
jgi:hypothetical protein